MKILLSGLLAAAALISPALASNGEIIRSGDPVPGHYIATFDPETERPRDVGNDVARMHGVTPDHIYEHALKGFSFRASEAKALAISRNPLVGRVYEATKMYAGGSGTQFSPPWNLDRIDQLTGTNGAFTYYYSGVNVVAYVIDSGINPTPGIPSSRIRQHMNFVTGEFTTQDCAGNFHGTYVAEVIGGLTFGVAKDVTFVNYRVLRCTSGGHPWASSSDVARGIDEVVATHPVGELAVANLSLYSDNGWEPVIDAAVERAVADGVVVVTIAGNITTQSASADACTVSPAHLGSSTSPNGIVTVGATGQNDSVWSGSKQGSCLDIFAPGDVVKVQSNPDWFVWGTSFAAPHVAGVAALRLERFASDPLYRTPQEIERSILSNATRDVLTGLSTGSPNRFLYTNFIKRRACC